MDDVRMKGFKERVSFTTILDAVSSIAKRTGHEVIGIGDATGRALYDDVYAPQDVPCFERSAMDGYAVVDSDTYGAGAYNLIALKIAGETTAGERGGSMGKGEAFRIMTGGMMPRGANAVVKVEDAHEEGGMVLVGRPVSRGENVSSRGEDIRKGSRVFRAGRVLLAHDAGVLASLGMREVKVHKRVRVGIIVTGNELLGEGEGKISDVNSHLLFSLVATCGAEVAGSVVVGDDRSLIKEEIESCDADIIVVTGGTACGKEDHVPGVVSEIGKVEVHGVAMRPAGAMGFGSVRGRAVFMLPGNPLAVCVAFDFFVRRAIALMTGSFDKSVRVFGRLTRKVASTGGRTDIFRVRYDDGLVEPIRAGGGAILSSMVRANAYLVVPENVEGYNAGKRVEVRMFL